MMIKYILELYNITGVIQVGASLGQELNYYYNLTDNIILVEPIPYLSNHLKKICPKCLVLPYGLGSTNEIMDLYLSSNNGESSSVLKPLSHTVHYPDVLFDGSIKIDVRTFESLSYDYQIDISKYNVLIIDTQGYDLEVMIGFGNHILNFELIICEYIEIDLYENNSNLNSIVEYL